MDKSVRGHNFKVSGLDVTIIVVSYNTRHLTLACLKSVFDQTSSVRYEVVVVDNDSIDGSAEAIRSAYPNIK
jgi:GT2 family glycosyltransferase